MLHCKFNICHVRDTKADANEKAVLRKQNCVQDTKNVFPNFQKHFFAFKMQILCLQYMLREGANDLGNTEETVTLNVSPSLSRCVPEQHILKIHNFLLGSKPLSFLFICSPMQHCEQHWLRMFLGQWFLVCVGHYASSHTQYLWEEYVAQ